MAQILNRNGRYSIQCLNRHGDRKTISIGKINRGHAEVIRNHVAELENAAASGTPFPRHTAIWLAEIGPALTASLAKAGLIEGGERLSQKLGEFTQAYIERRTDLKPRTIENLKQARRELVNFFGAEATLSQITRGRAKDFDRALRSRLKTATVSTHIKKTRQFFADALDRKMIGENPFKFVKPGSQKNTARMRYITSGDIQSVIAACPDAEWRLIFALARFAGLRVPTEILALRWDGIDWDRGRMTVWSPKTEHHEGGECRVVPIFPRILPHLREAFELAKPGAEYAIDRARNTNHRTRAEKIIRRAGLMPWPKPFQNLRSSCETDLASVFPIHVVCAWIGNTEAVAMNHYLQVREEDFRSAQTFLCGKLDQKESRMADTGRDHEKSAVPGAVDIAGNHQTFPESGHCENVSRADFEEKIYPQGESSEASISAENLQVAHKALQRALYAAKIRLSQYRSESLENLRREIASAKGGAA